MDIASSYNNRGSVYKDLGDLQNAKQYYEKALGIRTEKLPPDRIAIASAYHKLG